MRVPRWNFIALTRPHDAQRIYIRVKNNEQSKIKKNTDSISNLLSVPYSQLKTAAEEIVSDLKIYIISSFNIYCNNFNDMHIVRISSLFVDITEC